MLELPPAADFIVVPQNWDTLRAFLAAGTQWRVGPSGHVLGLDYAGAARAIEALGLTFNALFEGLQIMEAAVLETQSSPLTRKRR